LLKNYSYYRDAQVYQDRLDSSLHYVNPMLTFAADKRKRFKNPQDFDLHLSELIKMTENIYTKLEMDELTEPYRILGIKVDWTLFGTMGTLLASVMGFIAQYYTGGLP